jgi:hypothetical protein
MSSQQGTWKKEQHVTHEKDLHAHREICSAQLHTTSDKPTGMVML